MIIAESNEKSSRKGVCNISTAENKVVLVLCYYALFGLVTLTTFSVEYAHQELQYTAIQQYFVCEAAGSGQECDRSSFDSLGYHGLVLVGYFLLGLLPVVNLTFVINWTVAKASYKHFWMKYYPQIISIHTSTTNRQQGKSTMETVA